MSQTAKTVAFRADASATIGTGHIMRCITLADALTSAGTQTVFACRHLPDTLKNLLTDKGHALIQLNKPDPYPVTSKLEHACWLGVNQEFDAVETKDAIQHLAIDWMVIDHYALDYRWETKISALDCKIAVIDDLSDRKHTCELFINQNLIDDPASLYQDKLPSSAKKLIGTKFALLRDEFLNLNSSPLIRQKINKVLIFFGGVDADNLTTTAIDAITSLHTKLDQYLLVDVVIGSLHPNRSTIEEACQQQGFNCHIQTSEMAKLIIKADIAIGAGGSSCWERSALALPSILISLASNQTPIAEALARHNAAVYLGEHQRITPQKIANALESLIHTPAKLTTLSENCFQLCDGRGKYRIIDAMQDCS